MSNFWRSLSPFTRLLAVIVLAFVVLGGYGRFRLRPLRADAIAVGKLERDLAREVQQSRQRVAQLRRESDSAMRWEGYARILEQQSTGRSVRDVLDTCGSEDGPKVSVLNASFERRDRNGGFAQLGADLQVRGEYAAVIRLLDELDRSFPPIEILRAELRRPEITDERNSGDIVADLHGVIHEPR